MEILLLCIGLLIIAVCQDLTLEPTKEQQDPNFYRSPEWRALRVRVFAAWGRDCLICGKNIEPMTIDHVYPRSKFPELELEFTNCQPACSPCNRKKSNTDFTDYRDYRQMNEIVSDHAKR